MPRTGREPNHDWPAIRSAYEANDASIRAVASEYGLSDTAIRKRAKIEGWARVPRPERLERGAISAEAAVRPQMLLEPAIVQSLADAAVVDPRALAEQGADIVQRLLDELSATTTHLGEIEELITDDTRDDKDGRRRYAMTKAVNLSTRAAVAKNLALAAKTLADLAPASGLGGKKGQAAEAARRAGANGRFAAPTPPKLVVNNR